MLCHQPGIGGSLRRQMKKQVRRRLKVPTTLDASQILPRVLFVHATRRPTAQTSFLGHSDSLLDEIKTELEPKKESCAVLQWE